MKRPSTWPLLVILLVVGMMFATLMFNDRIQQTEAQMVDIDQTFQDQSNQIQLLTQELDRAFIQVKTLENQLQSLQDLLAQREDQLQTVTDQIQALSQSIPTETTQGDDLAQSALWTVAITALVLAALEFILQ